MNEIGMSEDAGWALPTSVLQTKLFLVGDAHPASN